MMTVADPQEAFGARSGQQQNQDEPTTSQQVREQVMGRARRMTRRMVCNDRTAGRGLEWSAAGLSDCGFAGGAGDARESVA